MRPAAEGTAGDGASQDDEERDPTRPGAASPPNVLLVDDRPGNLLALEAVLAPLAVRLVRASGAEAAVRQVDAEEFALILLDVQMPGTDGLEAARHIKARERGRIVPILFVTALDRDRRRVTTGYQAGAVDYLFKPLDPDELRAKVGAFLDLYRLQAEDRDRRRRYADRLVYSGEERYRRAAAEAEQARDALAAADRTKSEFLSRMSHELRTPLNAILGYVQLLDLGVLGGITAEQHTHLNRIRHSAVHLLGLVNEILDLVTLDVAEAHVTREVHHLGDACDAALALVRLEAATRGLTISGPAAGEPGPLYVGDPDRVRQVLVHLLTNAVKFTPPGGRVVLSCGVSDESTPDPDAADSEARAYAQVSDTGDGIDADQLETIFDAFTQLDGGRTRAHDGTGLGLTVSRRLARAMGGDVTVRSVAGEGATFRLWLPIPPAAERSDGSVGAPTASASPIDGPGQEALPSSAYAGIAVLGTSLARDVEAITGRHAGRLRADSSLPNTATLPEAQLRDHTGTLVGEIAHVLTVIGQTEGRAPELLRDGSEILRVVAELHGAQRHRLGWGEEHFTREIALLRGEIETVLRQASTEDTAAHPDGAALAHATLLIQRLLEQSRQTSLRGLRASQRVANA